MVVSFIGGRYKQELSVPGESHMAVISYWQTLSHNVVSSTSQHGQNSTHFSGDGH